jgi:hypothetical protein
MRAMNRRLPWLLVASIGALHANVGAHHSIAGIYDRAEQVTLNATVSEFRFVNPHPFIVIAVDEGRGRAEQWRVELDNRHELSEIGMSADSMKAGDRVVVTGSRARDGSHSLYALRLERRADGFVYEQVGSSPRINRSR